MIDDQVKEVLITVDPVFPGWYMEFKMLIHNKGRLVVDSFEHYWSWIGPEELDPCFLDHPTDDTTTHYPNEMYVPPGFIYTQELFLHDYNAFPDCAGTLCLDKSHYTVPTAPTTYALKPCQCVLLKEYIYLDIQEQVEYQCHWFRLAKQMGYRQHIPIVDLESYGWATDMTWPPP